MPSKTNFSFFKNDVMAEMRTKSYISIFDLVLRIVDKDLSFVLTFSVPVKKVAGLKKLFLKKVA